ncbi:MAG: RiPP maturation radical SAM protein 1 [Kiritimatiellaeota bacterium]|nr:RiPP maturation radical SAM protein 1 [Kiritimatiellota bacterium]
MRVPETPVLLIHMPCCTLMYPSLALSLFKARLSADGVVSKVLYFNLRFAEFAGYRTAISFADRYIYEHGKLLGEWIFSGALFRQSPAEVEEFLGLLREEEASVSRSLFAGPQGEAERLARLVRPQIEPFLEQCVRQIAAYRPRLVAFSSMFQQHSACLALAKRVKAALPRVFTVIGGNNCEGTKGVATLRCFPFVDAVVSGEADETFPQLVSSVLSDTPPNAMPGLHLQANLPEPDDDAPPECASTVPTVSLDALPFPDFSDFIEAVRDLPKKAGVEPALLLETSRGCWWCRKGGCNFCSCNGALRNYRVKSPDRAIAEIEHMVNTYAIRDIHMTDTVFPLSYLRRFTSELAGRKLGARLHYEARPVLTKAQLRSMREAGIVRIQAGIESFSDDILGLLNKGTEKMQNIALLKWCRELRIFLGWNLIWGIPGESARDYEEMACLFRMLTHLQPASGCARIYVGRFSNYYERADEFGIENIRPNRAYKYIYPFSERTRRDLAHYFEFDYAGGHDSCAYVAPLIEAFASWLRVHRQSELFVFNYPECAIVWDTRPCAVRRLTELTGWERDVYDACDAPVSLADLEARLATCRGEPCKSGALRDTLKYFIDGRLMLEHRGRYLSLAVKKDSRLTRSDFLRLDQRFARLGIALGLERLITGGVSAESE